jgi:hypothetical protein
MIEDWIVGIGSAAQNSQFKNKVIYAMQVQEKLEYDDYWKDPRFKRKRPVMNGSKRQMYGDNIYHRPVPDAPYIQEDSHHSLPGGQKNELNYNRDMPGKYVLISNHFWYFGQNAIVLPEELIFLADVKRYHKVIENEAQINTVVYWLASLSQSGYLGQPYMFRKAFERYKGEA